MGVAFAEILVYTTAMDFAFSLAPDSMKSTINAVNISMMSIADIIAGIMTTACSAWIPENNPNLGHYDRFYLLLGFMCLMTAIGFYLLRGTTKRVHAQSDSTPSI